MLRCRNEHNGKLFFFLRHGYFYKRKWMDDTSHSGFLLVFGFCVLDIERNIS
jgi:hypothetical protein